MSVGVESGFSNDELLHIRFPLHRACRDGDVGALCSLLQQCSASRADLAAEDSFYGWAPIHWAAHFGKLECVLQLVQVGCEVNAITSRFAQTPAHIAAFGGHPECLLWLLQAGADVNRQDYVGETPIHKAARAGSLECINALLFSGAKPELKNANGLTAADLARVQGFRECAQLLSNAENKLKQRNGFGHNGTDHSHIQGRSLLNGVSNRKRLFDCSEPNHIKKARTDCMDFPLKTLNGSAEEVESMAVEPTSDSQSGEPGPLPPMPTDSERHEDSVAMESLSPTPRPPKATPEASMPVPWRYGSIDTATSLRNGHVQQNNNDVNGFSSNGPCHPARTEPDHAETRSDMCGSLHLTASPSSCVSYRPSWGRFPSDSSEHLHYGYYHGFGDTAEDLDDADNRHDHNTTVRVEQHYDQEVLSAMQMFHGS